MTHLGEVLDASSGCKNIQTTETSNEQQAQPPAVGKGSSLIWSTMGKRRKPHKPQMSGLAGPNQENSQELTVVPLKFLDTREFLTLYPKDN